MRIKRNLKQRHVAAALGFTQGRVAQLENDGMPMPLHQAVLLANLFKIDTLDFIKELLAEMTESTIERNDFDQTAKHLHVEGQTCPTCGWQAAETKCGVPATDPTKEPIDLGELKLKSGPFERPMPAAMLEQRCRNLLHEKDVLTRRAEDAEDRVAKLEQRIKGFEQMTESLSRELDRLRAYINNRVAIDEGDIDRASQPLKAA
jgi:transcriptional regulator with XRE-family HTH domain